MHREEKTEVLIVGAGPVGLLTALLLAQSGVRIKIIDQEERPAAHSYACALHPQTLKLLERAGVLAPLLKVGRRIETIAFYEKENRRAQLNFSGPPCDFPFLLVVPQSVLEYLLEFQLNEHREFVQWNHRLSELKTNGQSVVATVDTMGETAKGYIVQDWDWEVLKQTPTRADFVVGADGHRSLVRQSLGIECERTGERELFAVYEFETDGQAGHEIRVAMDAATTNVLWPLSDRKLRWSFQLPAQDIADFPTKERKDIKFAEPSFDEEMRREIHLLAQWRAPWFKDEIRKVEWTTDVQFEPCVAKEFGRNRCWLAGDAAHQTGPVGVQSMNAGMVEGAELASRLTRILRHNAPLASLDSYNKNCRDEWRRLLGMEGGFQAADDSALWVKEHCEQLRSCIPATGADMTLLARQLGLVFDQPKVLCPAL